MERGAWKGAVHRFTKNQTWLKQFSMHTGLAWSLRIRIFFKYFQTRYACLATSCDDHVASHKTLYIEEY